MSFPVLSHVYGIWLECLWDDLFCSNLPNSQANLAIVFLKNGSNLAFVCLFSFLLHDKFYYKLYKHQMVGLGLEPVAKVRWRIHWAMATPLILLLCNLSLSALPLGLIEAFIFQHCNSTKTIVGIYDPRKSSKLRPLQLIRFVSDYILLTFLACRSKLGLLVNNLIYICKENFQQKP